jgi:hypothetical protein
MKIRYKKTIRSTNAGSHILINNIIAELDKPGYRIISQTQSCLEFKYKIWRVGSRGEVFNRVDGGVFDIDPESKTIVFSFYLSPILEILAISIAAIFGIIQDYHIFIFVIFIALMFVIRIIAVKIVANRMMENILNNELL